MTTERIQALRLTDDERYVPVTVQHGPLVDNATKMIADAQFEKVLKGLIEILQENQGDADYLSLPLNSGSRGFGLGVEMVISMLKKTLAPSKEME